MLELSGKKTSNAIITQAYQSRCSSWKPSSKARIASDFSTLLRIQKGEVEADFWKPCHQKMENISDDLEKRRISQPKESW